MKLIQATLSESASVDSQSNQLSIFNIIESVDIIGPLPIQFPRMTFVVVWERENPLNSSTEERVKCRVKVKSSLTTSSQGDEFDVVALPGQPRVRAIMNLAGVPINAVGVNEVIVEVQDGPRWKKAASVSFLVTASE